MADSGVRLTELLVSLSLATDLGLGQPMEHMVRAARLSMRLGHRLGLSDDELATLYDVSILTYVGCPIYGNEAAVAIGDDVDFRAGAAQIDLAGFSSMVFMLRRAGSGGSPLHRARQAAALMATGGRGIVEQMANHCSAAGVLADRLGLDAAVQSGIAQSYARWDGRGVPSGLGKDQLALSARISHVAEACEVFLRTAGSDEALEMVRARSGTHFDPAVAAAVGQHAQSLFSGLDDYSVDAIFEAEPVDRGTLTDEQLDRALEAIGDFCDLRCGYFGGHSRGTAALVESAAPLLNLGPEEATLVRRAASVHDVGRFGVAGTVWDKRGPLTNSERERMRMHVYFVERVFNRPEPLRRIGLLAATHHERLDGSGYHRGLGGPMLSVPARLLAAADAYHAMLQPRPHRPERSPEDAAIEIRKEVRAGRLDDSVTEAVLAAAGHAATPVRAGGPGGLTAREGDVLTLLAQGLSNKAVARALAVSPKTVSNHVEHIYAKLGVSNRAGAVLRAFERGLVPTFASATAPPP